METDSLLFDANGYLTPYTTIPVEWTVFAETFGWNGHRQGILDSYLLFVEQTNMLIVTPHRHWVGGSFSSRKPYPGDLDVVVFVPHTEFSRIESDLRQLKQTFSVLIDCYFVETFPTGHPKFSIGWGDELDWYHFWRTDRRKRLRGIIELAMNNGNSRRTGD